LASARLAASSVASLPLQPSWRPAGEVLKRKATQPPSLPFGLDPREAERRESLSRWHRIFTYSTRYRIKPDLARRIYDASVTAGIEPELAFRLVRVESVFDPSAASPVGAMGLTQLMLGTAREFEPNVTREQLLDPDINLRIGLKYLRSLIREYKGNLKLALLVYNRGPVAVQNALSLGRDPTNGYESVVMRGYRGRGVLD
jgi:soluble lytic murein transglycosylase-like protein